MKLNVAVVGAYGFVGKSLCSALKSTKNVALVEIGRNDDLENLIKKADTVIYAANSSKRFWAKNNPELDFHDTVEQTCKVKKLSKGKKFILISTISARVQLDTPYGRNRRSCETMLVDDSDALIFRLGPMYGTERPTGALHDIVSNNKCFVSGDTYYAYVDVEYNARKITELLHCKGLIELGARNSISLNEIKEAVGSRTTFEGPVDTQILQTTQKDAPDAYDIVSFAISSIPGAKK